MAREVKLRDLETMLEKLNYPATQDTVVDEYRDVTLILADGEENLGDIVAGSSDDVFESMDDLETEVLNLLPRHAVGEPYQSEGEG